MSFSVDLWNGFDIIKNEFSVNCKRIKQTLDIFTSYSLLIKEYVKGLDNLYKEAKEMKECPKSNSLLDETFILLINSFKIESENNKIYHNKIIKIINETKEKIEKIKIQISPYFLENMQNRESFNKAINNLSLKQETFNETFKELCNYLIENETQKLKERKSYTEKKSKILGHFLNNSTTKESSNKFHNIVSKLLQNKKDYIKCMIDTDKFREKYNKETEDLLTNLQKQFKLLILIYQTIIQNFVKDKIKFHIDISEASKKNDKNNYSLINYKNETYDFIIRNATKEFPLSKLDFIPYKLSQNSLYQKMSKYGEFSNEEQELIFEQIKAFIQDNKINVYENEYLRISMNNRAFTYAKKLENVNPIRRSGSSDMLNLKKMRKRHILTNLKSHNVFRKRDELDKFDKKKNNNIQRENKDDLSINSDLQKRANFSSIKEFVSKLFIPKAENKTDTLWDIYSDNSSDENEKDNNKEKNEINKEAYVYNQLLFGFMNFISKSNKGNIDNLEFFIYLLAYYRSKGCFELNDNAYKIFVNIFNYILINYKTANNIIKNIILYSQTFYKVDEDNPNNKIYILNGLKNHSTFNDVETWHRAINYNLSLSLKNCNTYSLNIVNKEEYMKNLDKIILNTIISYLYDLKLSTSDQKVYEQVKDYYITIYKLDKKVIEQHINKLFEEKKDTEENLKKEEKKEEKEEKEEQGVEIGVKEIKEEKIEIEEKEKGEKENEEKVEQENKEEKNMENAD
jgi:hypothetical protein